MDAPRIYPTAPGIGFALVASNSNDGWWTVSPVGGVPAETLLRRVVVGPAEMFRHGHYGVALLLSAPAPLLLGPAVGATFSLVTVATAMLPDWDTRMARIGHRGPTHTLPFAVAVALVFGSLAGVGWPFVREFVPATLPRAVASPTVGLFVAVGTFLGVISHLLADTLTPGYGTNALTPLWPASRRVVRLGVAGVDSPAWNWGLLAAGLLAQAIGLSLALGVG